MDNLVPILSLIVAILSVFVGPIIAWSIAKRQMRISHSIARQQIIAPMRQAWIDKLRDDLAELANTTRYHLYDADREPTEEEELRLGKIVYKIELMLNPKEDDYKRLIKLMTSLVYRRGSNREIDEAFQKNHPEFVQLSQQILKREWDRIEIETLLID